MTIQKKAVTMSVIIIWCILLLQGAASLWSLYWVLPWFDMLMHFLGGAWLALTFFALISKKIEFVVTHTFLMFVVMIGGTLFFGFLWEVMEFFIDLVLGTNFFQPDLPDTMSDLTFDLLGGLVAFGIVRFILHRNHYDRISQ